MKFIRSVADDGEATFRVVFFFHMQVPLMAVISTLIWVWLYSKKYSYLTSHVNGERNMFHHGKPFDCFHISL